MISIYTLFLFIFNYLFFLLEGFLETRHEDTLNTFSYLREVKSRHYCRVRTSAQPYSDGEGRDVGDEAGTGREEGGQG